MPRVDFEAGREYDDGRLTALVVVAPPPTNAEHDPVRVSLWRSEFNPD